MKRTNYQEKIFFDIPMLEINKGIVNADNDVVGQDINNFDVNSMYLEGLASSDHKDLDQQILKPSGFILQYFLKSGLINYNHQTNLSADAIIGEPVDTRIDVKNESFYLKSKLYPWSNMAKEVYRVALNMQNDKTSDRGLAYSVEGLTLEQEDEKVTKLLVTGCAVTFTPKNNDSFARVVKGITLDEVRELRKGYMLKPIYTEVEKGITKEYILNLNVGEDQILVDTNMKFHIRKNPIFKASSSEEIQKAIIILAQGVKEGFIKKEKEEELKELLQERMKFLVN